MFLAQLSQNGMYRIVGYQRIHPCCLQKFIRGRFLSRQNVTGSLDSDMPCFLSTSVFCLRRVQPVYNRHHNSLRLFTLVKTKVPNSFVLLFEVAQACGICLK